MLRRNGALSFESNGRAITLNGDRDRMDITMTVRNGCAKASMEYTLDDREIRRLYEFLYIQIHKEDFTKSDGNLKADARAFLEGYRCAT